MNLNRLCEERSDEANSKRHANLQEIASLRLMPWMACMQRSGVPEMQEHFSVAKTAKVPPGFVTAQRG
jgi:hypothetical protein